MNPKIIYLNPVVVLETRKFDFGRKKFLMHNVLEVIDDKNLSDDLFIEAISAIADIDASIAWCDRILKHVRTL